MYMRIFPDGQNFTYASWKYMDLVSKHFVYHYILSYIEGRRNTSTLRIVSRGYFFFDLLVYRPLFVIHTQITRLMGQHGAHLGPIGPRWAAWCPHDLAIWGVSAVVFSNAMDWLDVCRLSGFWLYLSLPRCSIMTHLGVRKSSLVHTNNRLLQVRYQPTI